MTRRATFALFFGLILAFSAATLRAQPRTSTAVQETDDEFKVITYKRFDDNREPNPTAAYQAARECMAKYAREDDQYTRYLKVWIAAYEEDEKNLRLAAELADREQQLLGSFAVPPLYGRQHNSCITHFMNARSSRQELYLIGSWHSTVIFVTLL